MATKAGTRKAQKEAFLEISENSRGSILGNFSDLTFPDYGHNCIANIGNSVLESFGLKAKGPKALEPFESRSGKVVLMTIDALGFSILSRILPKFSAKAIPLTSVFPSTTSAAYVSIARGVPPSAHGITGYWMKSGKGIAQMIEYKNHPFSQWKIEKKPKGIVLQKKNENPLQVLMSKGISCKTIVRRNYLNQPFSRLIGNQEPGIELHPFVYSSDFSVRIRKSIEEGGGPCFISAYWAVVDKIGHALGPGSEEVRAEVEKTFFVLNSELSRLSEKDKRETKFIITADHGQIAVSERNNRLWYLKDKKLSSFLSLPPAGDNRAVYFYAKKDKTEELGMHLSKSKFFSRNFAIFPSKTALAGGLFGPVGKKNRQALLSRIGDYVLIARKDAQLGHTEKSSLRGNHGSLTFDEVFVPLIAGTFGEIFGNS